MEKVLNMGNGLQLTVQYDNLGYYGGYYRQNVEIVDIDMPDDADKVSFDEAKISKELAKAAKVNSNLSCMLRIELTYVLKQFPSVKSIEFKGSFFSVNISNTMFPNVRIVTDDGKKEQALFAGVRQKKSEKELKNAFCLKEEEFLNLAGVTRICDRALDGCSTKNIVNAKGINKIEPDAFAGYTPALEEVEGCLVIDGILIAHEHNCENLIIPDDVRIIPMFTSFADVKQVTISSPIALESLKNANVQNVNSLNIKIEDFRDIKTLKEMRNVERIDVASRFLKSVDGIVYTADTQTLLYCPQPRKADVIVPDGTKVIAESAFDNCKDISCIQLPSSVARISDNAFSGCSKLKHIGLGNGIKKIGYAAFSDCGFEKITIPGSVRNIDAYAFANCYELSTLELNDGLEEIGFGFITNCPKLEELKLPPSVKQISVSKLSPSVKQISVRRNGYWIKTHAELVELSVAQIKKITVKGDKIPYNFIVNCISSKKTLELLFKDKTYFIPGAISPDDIYVLNDMFNAECISDDDLSHLYEWSGDTEIKQQTAILAYKEVHDDYIAKYLKRSSGNILKSMLNSTRRSADDEAIEFLKLGLTTETALKSALKIAQAKNKAEVASYLLNELDKNKRSISFKL